MANYTSNLKTWGDTGAEPPTGYSYLEGEQPVDAWDNNVTYNAIEDILHLISLTNTRLESSKNTNTNKPASPEDGELFWNQTNQVLEIYDSAFAGWREFVYSSAFDSHTASASAHHTRPVAGTNLSEDGSGNFNVVDASAGGTIDADTIDGKHASELGGGPLYGDGSDGSITRSANGNENGVIQATDYTIQSGVTMTVSQGYLVVLAKNKITINGTIDATGQGAAGGAGATSNTGEAGANGGNASFIPLSLGGAGGTESSNGNSGGNGGDGDDGFLKLATEAIGGNPGIFAEIRGTGKAGAGGGGGGSGADINTSTNNGNNGSAPGGGGSGGAGDGTGSGDGGAGGNGGGLVFLIAPTIEINGTITADGTNGQAGADADIAGGGGGGGSGGIIAIFASSLTDAGTYSAAAGTGGAAGTGTTANGGAGADGANGIIHKQTL